MLGSPVPPTRCARSRRPNCGHRHHVTIERGQRHVPVDRYSYREQQLRHRLHACVIKRTPVIREKRRGVFSAANALAAPMRSNERLTSPAAGTSVGSLCRHSSVSGFATRAIYCGSITRSGTLGS